MLDNQGVHTRPSRITKYLDVLKRVECLATPRQSRRRVVLLPGFRGQS